MALVPSNGFKVVAKLPLSEGEKIIWMDSSKHHVVLMSDVGRLFIIDANYNVSEIAEDEHGSGIKWYPCALCGDWYKNPKRARLCCQGLDNE